MDEYAKEELLEALRVVSSTISKYDIYTNGKQCEPVPRHPQINELLAEKIIRKHGLK